MGREGARINRLSVSAHRRRGVPMVQSAVENAFRTELSAAGPAVQRGLLVIRKIALGRIASHRDQGAINARLAAILKQARGAAQSHHSSVEVSEDAAFFPDPITPALDVARALGTGSAAPQTWPFRAVFGEAIFQPPALLLDAILAQQLEVRQAGPAVVAILQALGPAMPGLVQALAPSRQSEVLRAICFGQPSVQARQLERGDLERLSSDLRLLTMVEAGESVATELPAGVAVTQRARDVMLAALLSAPGRPVSTRRVAILRDLLAAVSTSDARENGPRTALSQCSTWLAELLLPASETQLTAVLAQLAKRVDRQIEFLAVMARSATIETSPAQHAGKPTVKAREVAESPNEEEKETEEQAQAFSESSMPSRFESTRHAGLANLITLLDALYGKWLNDPSHLEHATGWHLLRRIMQRFNVHPEDPAACFLASPGDLPELDDAPRGFWLHPQCLGASDRAITISQVADHAGWRMAQHGSIVIAVWRGRAPKPIRQLLGQAPKLQRVDARPFSSRVILWSAELGLRRYLRAGPNMRMADLVRRAGSLARTATHLDACFDGSVIDLNIRRWALDLSPGWCGWLWRVVTIYYDFDHPGAAPDGGGDQHAS